MKQMVKKTLLSVFYKYNAKNTMTVDNNIGGALLPPKSDFKLISNYIVDKINPEKWTLKTDSVSQNFTAKISAANPYEILVQSDFVVGEKNISLLFQKLQFLLFMKKMQNQKGLILRLIKLRIMALFSLH